MDDEKPFTPNPGRLTNIDDVRELAVWAREMPSHLGKLDSLTITGSVQYWDEPQALQGSREGELAHVGTFAAMLAGLLPHPEIGLTCNSSKWESRIEETFCQVLSEVC